MYINSLRPDALSYQDELCDWLDDFSNLRFAFQPGTFHLEAGPERLARLYARAELLLCSRTAAEEIAGSDGDSRGLLDALLALGATNVIVRKVSC